MTDDVDEIERRRALRGTLPGLAVTLAGQTYEAIEASRRSFFIRVADPERFRLGDAFDARVADRIACRLEVVRKEIDPRRGVALRLVTIDPDNEAALRDLLGPLGEK